MDALDLWRAELASGFRGQRADTPSTWRFDALWRAACAVAFAREADRLSLPRVAAVWRRQAERIVVSAAARLRDRRRFAAGSWPDENV